MLFARPGKLIKAKPKKGLPTVDEALLRIAALYKVEETIRGSNPEHRRTVRQDSRPLVDVFFSWLTARATRVSRKSDLGEAMADMLRRKALFAGHDEGGWSWARFASLIGSCKMNRVDPYGYQVDLFTRLTSGHLAKDIDALMPWANSPAALSEIASHPEK